jgi:glyoxylase I family protein
MKFSTIHHVAITCSDYQKLKHFYTNILALKIIDEIFCSGINSHEVNLKVENTHMNYSLFLILTKDLPILKPLD